MVVRTFSSTFANASLCFCCLATVDIREIRWIVSLNYSYGNPAASDSSSNKHSVQVFAAQWSINLLARTRITKHILPRDEDIFYDGFFLSKRKSQFTRQGSHDFFFSATGIRVGYFFFLPAVFTRSLAQTGSGGGREYEEGGWAHGSGIKGRIIRVPSAARDLVP